MYNFLLWRWRLFSAEDYFNEWFEGIQNSTYSSLIKNLDV